MGDCIERGRRLVADTLREVRAYSEQVKTVWALLQPENGSSAQRRNDFDALAALHGGNADSVLLSMGKIMLSFAPGLFAGGDDLQLPQDNLDLERAFRSPKSHQRKIHGRAHAGVRIVQEGPILLPTLDAHCRHPEAFEPKELFAYARATVPDAQLAAEQRRRIMRKARAQKSRTKLLAQLERRFTGRDPPAQARIGPTSLS